jgi:hypothetical protein
MSVPGNGPRLPQRPSEITTGSSSLPQGSTCSGCGYVGGPAEQPVPRDVVAVLASGDGEPNWSVDFWIADAEAAAARASELGGSVVVPPRERPGFLNTVIADPAGAVLSLSELLVPARAG